MFAYRGETAELEDAQPFICAECGGTLDDIILASVPWLRYASVLIGVTVICGLAAFAAFRLRGTIEKAHRERTKAATLTISPPIVDTAPIGMPLTLTETPSPRTRPATAEPPAPTPHEDQDARIIAQQRVDLDAGARENKEVKNDVLTRIDSIPGISQGNKDRLYQSVDHARHMGKVLTVCFGPGSAALSGASIRELKAELGKPEVANLRRNPDAVFVVLGYADVSGSPELNKLISQNRADSVRTTMGSKAGVSNVLHSVAMGPSKLLDAKKLDKNRSAEVWVVLP